MRRWIEPQDVEIPAGFREAVGGHPLVAKTLVRRGLSDVTAARAFLDPNRYTPAPPSDLPGLIRAVERLEKAIRNDESICVWGDFDVDGQTATTLLVSTLQDLGGDVRFYIPNRARESHGINLTALRELLDGGIALLLTCDTGISEHEAIAYAQARGGVDVVVTDHHELPGVLPEAHAIVNPKMLPREHPLRELPGVGCAYKVAEALYERAGRGGDVHRHLDLVALGTVADVATQTGDTRYLLQRGLEALRQTPRLGLRALMELAELNPDLLTEEHIGFVLGPRLNALGRLADAGVAVEFLTTDDIVRARTLAGQLEALNAQRALLTSQVMQAAESQIERDRSLLNYAALVLSHPGWPAGVIGIVAGRLAERYNRPVILIATPPGEIGRGSARSVEGCNITEAIGTHAELLGGYGGHAMAAGLSIAPERIPEFRRALSDTVFQMMGEIEEQPPLQIDAYVPLSNLALDLVQELERLAPFGPGNAPVVLAARGLVLASSEAVGRGGEHLVLNAEDEQGSSHRVMWWHGAGWPLPEGRFDLAYVVRASDYLGRRGVQVEWVDARPIEEPALRVETRPRIGLVDHRRAPNPGRLLESLRAQDDVAIWAEADAREDVGGLDRNELTAASTLIVWTIPPGPEEFRAVLDRVAPKSVVLVGANAGAESAEKFLTRLAGLVKHALGASQGRVRISSLAAATAQREATVRAGVSWLLAQGHVTVMESEGDAMRLAAGDRSASRDTGRAMEEVKALLAETAAYRAYFLRADGEMLLGDA